MMGKNKNPVSPPADTGSSSAIISWLLNERWVMIPMCDMAEPDSTFYQTLQATAV